MSPEQKLLKDMYHSQRLIPLGSKAKVKVELLRDQLPDRSLRLLAVDPIGTVVDYKMTDATGIGVVLQLGDGSLLWFFNQELQSLDVDSVSPTFSENDKYILQDFDYENVNKNRFQRNNEPFDIGNSVPELLNPLNFLKWLTYSLKDVF